MQSIAVSLIFFVRVLKNPMGYCKLILLCFEEGTKVAQNQFSWASKAVNHLGDNK